MSLGACAECWEWPCVCGRGYETWSLQRLEQLADAIDVAKGRAIERYKRDKADELWRAQWKAAREEPEEPIDALPPRERIAGYFVP